MALLSDFIKAAQLTRASAGLITTSPALTVKSDLGNETLYICPVRSPSLPMAFAIPSTFSCPILVWANTGLPSTSDPAAASTLTYHVSSHPPDARFGRRASNRRRLPECGLRCLRQ